MKRLPLIKDGVWQNPVQRGYVLECCDCRLRHRMDFRVRGKTVQFRAWRIHDRRKKRRAVN